MSIFSPGNADDSQERDAERREAMRARFLDFVDSKDMYRIYQEGMAAGWSLGDVQRAIDALVEAKADEFGTKEPL